MRGQSEIEILREVVQKLVPLLSSKGLRVTQQGAQAFVENDANGQPIRVNIPFLPDDASEALILAIHGFIDHEVAHVLFTEFTYKRAERQKDPRLQSLWNIMEDPMIEKLMGEKFPGAAINIEKTRGFFLEKITKPGLESVKGDPNKEANWLMVPAMRALAGQKTMREFMDANGYWTHPALAEILAKLPADFETRAAAMRSTRDAFALSSELWDSLYKKAAPPPAPPMPSPPSEPEEGKSEKSDDPTGEGSNESKPEDEEDKGSGGESSDETDQSKGTDEEEAEEEDKESEDAAGEEPETEESEGDDVASEDEPGAGDDADAESNDGDGEREENDGADAGESKSSDEADADDDAEDEASGAGGSEEEEEESEAAEGDAGPVGTADADAEGDDSGEDAVSDGKPDASGEDDEAEIDPEEGEGQPGSGSEEVDEIPEMTEQEKDPFSGAIAEHLAEEAIRQIKVADYRIFTQDYDRIEPYKAPDLSKMDTRSKNQFLKDFEEFDGSTRGMIAPMQKDIERMMAARALSLNVPGMRSGRLHQSGLHKLRTGDDRVFRRKFDHKMKATAVGLLIDNSGSMSGWNKEAKIYVAMQAGYALGQTLERVNVPCEILGFTTHEFPPNVLHAIESEERRVGKRYSSYSPLYMPVFKSFDQRMTPDVKQAMMHAAVERDYLASNTDGEAVEVASRRLLKRREERKILMVLSDGNPASMVSSEGRRELPAHLHMAIDKAQKAGIEVLGIGIQTDAVRTFYPRHIILHDIATLPTTIMSEMKKFLLK